MMRFLFLIILSFSLSLTADSQDRIITGQVFSLQDGAALPGVSVIVKGFSKGTATDKEGRYKIALSGNSKELIFSNVGYTPQEITVSNSPVINVKLEENAATLSNVIVTAAGIRRQKNKLGYSVSTINADQLAQKSEPDPIRSLSGKVAGVNIQGSGGVAGGGTNITIRGNSSLGNNNQPLFVVDGVPFDNFSFTNAGSATVGGAGITNRGF